VSNREAALLLSFVPVQNAQEKEEGTTIKKKKATCMALDSGEEMYQRPCAIRQAFWTKLQSPGLDKIFTNSYKNVWPS